MITFNGKACCSQMSEKDLRAENATCSCSKVEDEPSQLVSHVFI